MEQKNGSAGHCRKCGADVDRDQVYCRQCRIEPADGNIAVAEVEKEEPARPGKNRRKMMVLRIILLACILAIVISLPKVMDALQAKQPIRQGTFETDAQADTCIGNLWHIARLLQEGQLPGKDILCPASGKPYEIIKVGADTLARCPDPQLHGCGELSVSKLSPCPKIKK